jgi:nucleolar protein 9
LQERIAKSVLPHESALAASYYGKYFARNLHLIMLKRDPVAWRDMQRNQKAAALKAASAATTATDTPSATKLAPPQDKAEHGKKRKRAAGDLDEIDVLFSKIPHTGNNTASKGRLPPQQDAHFSTVADSQAADVQLGEVLGAIKKVSKKEGLRKSKRS